MSIAILALVLVLGFIVGESLMIGGIFWLVDSNYLGELVPGYGFILSAILIVPILMTVLLMVSGW